MLYVYEHANQLYNATSVCVGYGHATYSFRANMNNLANITSLSKR